MSLQEEIDKARHNIRTDGYALSIGELMSMYEKEELDIHPEFQRFFRWTPKQKSALVESILLGIPIPSIFVSQREDGVWDVVDGVQRLSTIFEFAGILRNEKNEKVPAPRLVKTTYLESIDGVQWDDDEHPNKSFNNAQRLLVKRAKLNVSIIQKESSEATKYELFQRLNAGGSALSDQEIRNCILLMLNKDFYRWIKSLSEDNNFMECIGLSDRVIESKYDMELVLRFIILRTIPIAKLAKVGDIGEFLTERAKELALDKNFDRKGEERAFKTTFEILATIGADSFRRYDDSKKRFLGGFSISAFEIIALGIGHNYKKFTAKRDLAENLIKKVWSEKELSQFSGAGVSASRRIPKTIPLGRKMFAV